MARNHGAHLQSQLLSDKAGESLLQGQPGQLGETLCHLLKITIKRAADTAEGSLGWIPRAGGEKDRVLTNVHTLNFDHTPVDI